MVDWNLTSSDPLHLSIAADIRCTTPNYTNDHIWELNLSGGEPPALAIQTTFGLRARNIRLFPRFVEGDSAILDPGMFSVAPIVKRFYPNFLQVEFSPFIGIDVQIEYWVPDSVALAGRIQIINSRLTNRQINFQWANVLSPIDGGHRMSPIEMDKTTILNGQTEGIFPVFFMTGGPKVSPGPYPALSLDLDLIPGGSREIIWVLASLDCTENSFEYARMVASRAWEAEKARLTVLNESLIDIETGNPDWNSTFAFTQKFAFGLFIGKSNHLPFPSFVLCRQPDQGFSPLGDGSDYKFLWEGQSPLESDFLSSVLLPTAPELVKGLLKNFFETQSQSGFIDNKTGLAGQHSRIMATPILAHLTWRLYETLEDPSFLLEVFPGLLRYVQAWFSDQQDRDGDGLPEWAHPSQSGFDDHPVFSHWHPKSQGGDISKVESPSLCAFLYREIQVLIKIAQITQQSNPIAALEALAENLKTAVESSWDNKDSIYRNWDRESHFSPNGEHLGERIGPGVIHINREFAQPVRLSFRIVTTADKTRKIKIFIHGIGPTGSHRIESIDTSQFRWHINRGNVSSERIFKTIEYIEIVGVTPKDYIVIEVLNLSLLDHTLLLPLWAGIPDKTRAHQLVTETITDPDRFWKPYGIVACPGEPDLLDTSSSAIHMIWNNLIGEGLLRYGFREEAADLVSRLMSGVIKNLKSDHSFYNYYDAGTGQGRGERNVLGGMAPLSLFMKTLGVQILSPAKIFISGRNPFPWPVTIRYRGLSVYRELQKTKIIFPGGQSAMVKSDEPRIIKLEGNSWQ